MRQVVRRPARVLQQRHIRFTIARNRVQLPSRFRALADVPGYDLDHGLLHASRPNLLWRSRIHRHCRQRGSRRGERQEGVLRERSLQARLDKPILHALFSGRQSTAADRECSTASQGCGRVPSPGKWRIEGNAGIVGPSGCGAFVARVKVRNYSKHLREDDSLHCARRREARLANHGLARFHENASIAAPACDAGSSDNREE